MNKGKILVLGNSGAGKSLKSTQRENPGMKWDEAIDYCIDNFEKDDAKKRIKSYILKLDEMYQKRIKQAATASIVQCTNIFDEELKKGMQEKAKSIIIKSKR